MNLRRDLEGQAGRDLPKELGLGRKGGGRQGQAGLGVVWEAGGFSQPFSASCGGLQAANLVRRRPLCGANTMCAMGQGRKEGG